MSSVLIVIAGVVLLLAALLHVFIFYLESVVWTGPLARATFGTTAEQAEQNKQLAFNQGFYNLFLALTVVAGLILYLVGRDDQAYAVLIAGALPMVLAGLVLFASDASKRQAAIKQLALPPAGLILLVIGVASGGA